MLISTRKMRALTLGIPLTLVLGASACATMGWTSDRDTLLKTASFDHDCPPEQIKILGEQEEGLGAASFKLEVCGKVRRYKRMGTLYTDAEKGSPVPGT